MHKSFLYAVIFCLSTVSLCLCDLSPTKHAADNDVHSIPDVVEACTISSKTTKTKRIAVVGSGIAGASVAYFLHERLHLVGGTAKDSSIVVFEKSHELGGRLKHISIDGAAVELGGSVYIDQNYNIRNFTKKFNFTEVSFKDESFFGIWNGEAFAFLESHWSLWTKLKALYRWGFSPLVARKHAIAAKDCFLSLYPPIKINHTSYSSPKDLLEAADLATLVKRQFKKELLDHGVGERTIDEIVTTMTRINYLQSTFEMQSLAGYVAMVGSGDNVFSLKEGVSSICKSALESSGATIQLNSTVKMISLKANSESTSSPSSPVYILSIFDSNGVPRQEEFDVVVLAAPLELAGLELVDIPLPPTANVRRAFQTVHVTIVTGDVNHSYFGLSSTEELPRTIGTVESDKIPFISISKKGTQGAQGVYKVFSRERVSEALLNSLFHNRTFTYRHEWKAYPKLRPTEEFPPFDLHTQLYYVNAMETGLSTMESESLAAENIVNLILSKW